MAPPATPSLCRSCLTDLSEIEADRGPQKRCPSCRSFKIVRHGELFDLGIAHIDCDAFYAAVEKRDDPSLRDKPLIIGGGRRGVVSTACYIARTYGVHSAQPMFKALKACPHAVVVKPDMAKYAAVGRTIRALMEETTPLVQPLSIDEAFLDLTGTERLHKHPPAVTLARLIKRIEAETGVTASVGLSYNKFLAKVASDLDKPQGFSVIGRREALAFLAEQPVSIIWGVGKAFQKSLAKDGITKIAQLQRAEESDLMKRYGVMGRRLWRLARGEDERAVTPREPIKSVSNETTFGEDIQNAEELKRILWRLCEKVSGRMKDKCLAGKTVTLKLKTAEFKTRTRSRTLDRPTQLADVLYRHGCELLMPEVGATPFRLIGIGLSGLVDAAHADHADLLDPGAERRAKAERAVDALREKFSETFIGKGRALKR